MAWRKWKIGAVVSLILSLFVALSVLASGATWLTFVVAFGAAAVTHFGTYIKEHPVDNIKFEGEEDPNK